MHKLARSTSSISFHSASRSVHPRPRKQHTNPIFFSFRLNMSGVTESGAGTHTTRQPNAQEKQIIDDILCLYQLKPSHQAYSHYAENAVFHDPVSIARGLDSIKSQFNGMPKLFAESTTESKPCTLKLMRFQSRPRTDELPFWVNRV